ncbi:MAG TPA: hypothetical protein VNE63_21125 [Candidatus Acidoferrales bacterium]|nr:hypothetical protein [Candidatus Acidoferrales bacterium]
MALKSELVDLIATQEPNTTAKEEIVVVTVPMNFLRDPQQRGGTLRLHLSIHQAEYLAAQIQPVLVVARSFRQQRT